MSIFDESAVRRDTGLFADAFVSLGRQWLLRSGLWKLATGAVVSALILGGWGYAFAQGSNASLERELQVMAGNPAFHRASDLLDENEFEREAAQAVAILAQIRETNEVKRAHSERQSQKR